MKTIEGTGFSAYFDEEHHIVVGIYQELLNATVTAEAYMKGGRFMLEIGMETIRGLVFDFSQVKRFERGNLETAQRESFRANQRFDMSHFPVAMVVKTSLQEQMVRIAMHITPEQQRHKIVYSLEEAYAYINAWHNKRATAEHGSSSS